MISLNHLKISVSLGCAALAIQSSPAASSGDFLKSLSISLPQESPWDITGAASLALADGNSDSLTYALQVRATYENGTTEGTLGADWHYSESAGVSATDSFRLYGQQNRFISDRVYLGLNGSYLTDHIADLNYRVDIGAGLGSYSIKNEQTSLAFEIGPGFAWESQGGISRDLITVRFFQRLKHQISDQTKLWQTAIFSPNIDHFGDYRLTTEAGIETTLNNQWALRSSLRYQYDKTPATDRQRNDLSLLLGLSYSLSGFPDPTHTEGPSLKPENAAPESIQMGWSSDAAVAFSYASGNSDSLSVGLSFDSAYREQSRELFLNGAFTYGEVAGTPSSDTLRGAAQFNTFLSDLNYFGARVGYDRDQLAEVSYRVTPAATLGTYLIKNDEMTVSIEAGPGLTIENVGGRSDQNYSILAAEKFTWELNEQMTFKQSLSALIDPSNSGNGTLSVDAQLDTNITSNLSWRLALGWTYDRTPATGRVKGDTTLTSGIAVKF